ncbi:hypothetical protein A6302_01202 [Methylobrevis pamukkalensis]|uniref:Uncharacterized protein n=1 Tax=Methylobrevis pamukkalensis TaxID=1439726 RepID=A0A1E3H5J2_9HYPH|nr:hypothetical protein A6302_01202 [Methylobrevis pamukkalensis]
MARFGTTSPCSAALSDVPQAAKPWARFPQARRERRGPFSACACVRSR